MCNESCASSSHDDILAEFNLFIGVVERRMKNGSFSLIIIDNSDLDRIKASPSNDIFTDKNYVMNSIINSTNLTLAYYFSLDPYEFTLGTNKSLEFQKNDFNEYTSKLCIFYKRVLGEIIDEKL
jgi:hypothetical protein